MVKTMVSGVKTTVVRQLRPEQAVRRVGLLLLVVLSISAMKSWAQDVGLAQRQAGVAERYQRLEELLLRLADVEAAENPERSALLRRAARQSRDQFVLNKIQSASEALRSQQFQMRSKTKALRRKDWQRC